MKIFGKIVDLYRREIYPGILTMNEKSISSVERSHSKEDLYIIPGLIDAHIHIESSMVTPGSFAMEAVSRGTTGVVSDPHEIANILGISGVKFMIEDSKKSPLKFWFGAPSCVPATNFETTGAVIDHKGIEELLKMPEIKYLAEMMNYPGVVNDDPEILLKIKAAKNIGKKIDGHAPGLSGTALDKYIKAGITTDHECTSLEEALEKISKGMKILIREGSAARNLKSLKELIKTNPEMVMLCSDDLHPEMLVTRHLNKIVADLISEGYNLFDVLRTCTVNPALHYGLEAGLLQKGHPADFIVVDDPKKMNILETWINGKKVFDRGRVLFDYKSDPPVNKFNCSKISTQEICVLKTASKIRVIKAFDGELITKEMIADSVGGQCVVSDLKSDILKIVVKDRYNDGPAAVGFINGFGLKKGAMASSVAHDSHNIVCVGTNDNDIVNAVNEVIRMKGGLAVSAGEKMDSLPLPVAGIMSDMKVKKVADGYGSLSEEIKSFGCKLSAPFMTLSFMALLVIPELKISDKGLFDGRRFEPVSLFID
jgi:adenine deaminase